MGNLPISDDDKAFIDLDNQLCFQLYTASRALTKSYQPALKALGLTYPQYLVMLVLWKAWDEGLKPTVSEIGQKLHLDSGTLTPLIKRLESRDLLERQRNDKDERQVQIAPTAAGVSLSESAPDVPKSLLCELQDIPLDEVIALREQLKGLIDKLAF